jgi:predicted DCC family thiol-disulfide oxidoreductase YuxK
MEKAQELLDQGHLIILFDGVCNLCNSSVDFIVQNRRDDTIRFASLQSDWVEDYLQKNYSDIDIKDSIILLKPEELLQQSDAALTISRYLQFPYNLLSAGFIIPKIIREPIYEWIARNRYKWFGKKESCRIPSPDERGLFV